MNFIVFSLANKQENNKIITTAGNYKHLSYHINMREQ